MHFKLSSGHRMMFIPGFVRLDFILKSRFKNSFFRELKFFHFILLGELVIVLVNRGRCFKILPD